jgi:hypothetical protein
VVFPTADEKHGTGTRIDLRVRARVSVALRAGLSVVTHMGPGRLPSDPPC